MSLTPALYEYLNHCRAHALAHPDKPWADGRPGNQGTRIMSQLVALGCIERRETPYTQARITAKGIETWKEHRKTLMPHGITIERGTQVVFARRRIGWLHRTGAKRGSKPQWYTETEDGKFSSGHLAERVEAVRALMKHLGMPVPGEES